MKNILTTNDEKITEKAFSQSIIVSIASIFLCIVILCSMTYAWFSEDVSNDENKLVAGHFSIEVVSVLLVESEELSVSSEQEILPDAHGNYTLDRGKYEITLRPTDETTVKGHCAISIDGNKYRTGVILNEHTVSEAHPTPNSPFVFYLVLTEASSIRIESRWGIPANPVIAKDGTIELPAPSIDDEAPLEE